ncbi:MAG: sulfatase activating formylglycine-generating enzyme [Halocynthiibacter sp.]|jgi:formylglycine-generating enzyme required for sulfatase activity
MAAIAHKTLMSLSKVLAGVVAAALIGAAWMTTRGPDFQFVPQMADRAVVLPNGAQIYVQRYEVTVAEWNRCNADGACELLLRAPAKADPEMTPATGLSYADVIQYIDWINHNARHEFRLPTVEEWDFMAKDVLPKAHDPIFTDPELSWASAYLTEGIAPRKLSPIGSFSTSAHGIADLDGSVWEWTQDCYAGKGGVVIDPDRCPAYFVGGEHVAAIPTLVRDPARGGCAVGSPPAHLGLRLVTDHNI